MMKQKYDIVFLTNVPSFYKIRLFNKIAEKKKILVLFTNVDSIVREKDFFDEPVSFSYRNLSQNSLFCLFQMLGVIFLRYDMIVGSGWDSFPYWIAALLSSKKKNACIIESSIYDTALGGMKTFLKRLYIRRMNLVFVPGKSNKRLVEVLIGTGKCKIVEFGGCGLLNYVPQPPFIYRKVVKRFLYVGRLAEEKNLRLLIDVFNDLSDLELWIVGKGELEEVLKDKAKSNIRFLGSIRNKQLTNIYRDADVFILPSKYEPWGLVVEEALNNGTPVIVSNKVGCRDDLVTCDTGLVFAHQSSNDMIMKIEKILDVSFYNRLRLGVSRLNFEKRAKRQIEAFVNKE